VNEPPSRRPRGRPRSAPVDAALLDAALAEFTVNGFHVMSMESIAARAGVSKVSLYRRWKSKQAVVADVLKHLSDTRAPEDHGSLHADIDALLHAAISTPRAKSDAKIFIRTMGEVSDDPTLLDLYRQHLLRPRIDQVRALLERARTRGEIDDTVQTEVAAAMIAGPLVLYYIALLVEADIAWPHDLAQQLTRYVLAGIQPAVTDSA
jgi:AcrR family transcriptional regulator